MAARKHRSARTQLEETNAFADPVEADAAGVRLVLPDSSPPATDWRIVAGPRECSRAQEGSDIDVGWAWDIAHDGEERTIRVEVAGDRMGMPGLPKEAQRAIATRGRSAITPILAHPEPPDRLLVTGEGILPRLTVTASSPAPEAPPHSNEARSHEGTAPPHNLHRPLSRPALAVRPACPMTTPADLSAAPQRCPTRQHQIGQQMGNMRATETAETDRGQHSTGTRIYPANPRFIQPYRTRPRPFGAPLDQVVKVRVLAPQPHESSRSGGSFLSHASLGASALDRRGRT